MEQKEVLIAAIAVIAVLTFVYIKVIYFSDVFTDEVVIEEHEEIVPDVPEPVLQQSEETLIDEELVPNADTPAKPKPAEELAPGLRNIQYTVSDFLNGKPDYEVLMNATHRKIIYAERDIFNEVYFDTVYLDMKEGRAVGYCESASCKNKEQGAILIYTKYQLITPLDWKQMVETAEAQNGTYIGGKDTVYKTMNNVQVWLDAYYGLPLKVQESTNEPVYFTYAEINNPNVNPAPAKGFEIASS